MFSERAPLYEWFCDSEVNTCYNAVDGHVLNGRADQKAIIYDSPITDTKYSITFSELLEKVATLAGALSSKGISKGDRVIIYMPMVPEGIITMLAYARIGAIHSMLFGGFASNELAVRIDDAKPKAMIAASCGLEPNRIVQYKPLIDSAIELANYKPETVVVLQRPKCEAELINGRDHDWDLIQKNVEKSPCVPVEGSHPAYILYTSGTLGLQK